MIPIVNILSHSPHNNAQNNTPKIDLDIHKQESGEGTGQERKENDFAMRTKQDKIKSHIHWLTGNMTNTYMTTAYMASLRLFVYTNSCQKAEMNNLIWIQKVTLATFSI